MPFSQQLRVILLFATAGTPGRGRTASSVLPLQAGICAKADKAGRSGTGGFVQNADKRQTGRKTIPTGLTNVVLHVIITKLLKTASYSKDSRHERKLSKTCRGIAIDIKLSVSFPCCLVSIGKGLFCTLNTIKIIRR